MSSSTHQDSPKVPEGGWAPIELVRPKDADLARPWPPHPGETIDESYEAETYIPVSGLLSDAVVDAATKRFTNIHWHNAPLKYGGHARDTMRAALQAAIEQLGGGQGE